MVVVGVPDGPYPVQIHPPSNFGTQLAFARRASSDAHFFAKCVKAKDNKLLRELIDGRPNRYPRVEGMDELARDYSACYPGFDPFYAWKGKRYGECDPRGEFDPILEKKHGQSNVVGARTERVICQAFYNRGALVEKVLSEYAPDLSFTSEQLFSPAVLKRFHEREDWFNTTRTKQERVYSEVVSCLIAIHPQWALASLKTTPNSDAEAKLRAAMIGTTPECVGGAKQVEVDPFQFRVYLVDEIYSWAVALRGTDSLIPLD